MVSKNILATYRRPTGWLGRTLWFYEEIASTNDVALAAAREGAAAGLVVVADAQTAGRGRLNRHWEAPRGTSLLVSLLFRPPAPFAVQAARTTMACGLGLRAAVLEVAGVSVDLKWPNDLIYQPSGADGAWKKLGGMLSEVALSEQGEPRALVVGWGINVNIPEAMLAKLSPQAASLLTLGGRLVDRTALLDCALKEIEGRYEAVVAGEDPLPSWRAAVAWLGERVEVVGPGKRVSGIALDVAADGALLVRLADGEIRRVTAGDVSLRRQFNA